MSGSSRFRYFNNANITAFFFVRSRSITKSSNSICESSLEVVSCPERSESVVGVSFDEENIAFHRKLKAMIRYFRINTFSLVSDTNFFKCAKVVVGIMQLCLFPLHST